MCSVGIYLFAVTVDALPFGIFRFALTKTETETHVLSCLKVKQTSNEK